MTGHLSAGRTRAFLLSRGTEFSCIFDNSDICATWISPLSLVGVQHVAVQRRNAAFLAPQRMAAGMTLFPVHSQKAQLKRAPLSSVWLEKLVWGHKESGKLVCTYRWFFCTAYIVLPSTGHRYNRLVYARYNSGFTSTSLIYLFVLYTDFRGINIR
jgi:hypothetical protein